MRRRSRLLRVAKWGGVVVCVIIAGGGAILLYWLCVFSPTRYPLVNYWARRLIEVGQPGENSYFAVWLLSSIFVTSATARLFWLDRRHALPGHCPCGYDLRGNVSGTCPECGRETTEPATGTTR